MPQDEVVLKYHSHTHDSKGLHIKYYGADTKFNREEWGLTFDNIKDGLNKPFVLTSGKVSYGPYGLYHPVLWGLKPYAAFPNVNTEIAYSWDHAIGYCSDLSTGSEIAVASMQNGNPDSFEKDAIFPTMTITDEKAIEEFMNDESLIPRSISIGIVGYHKNDKGLYDDYNIFHWAAVPLGFGAYGMKARQIAACVGTKGECLPQLKVASITPNQKEYCIATALKDLKSNSSYDKEKPISIPEIKVAGDNKDTKDEGQKNNPSPIKIMAIKPEYLGIPAAQTKTESEKKDTETSNNNGDSQVLSAVEALKKEIDDLKAGSAKKDREMELRKITPQFLFKNQDEYEKAIKENLESDKTIDHIQDVYKVQMENFALQQKSHTPEAVTTQPGEIAGGVPDAVGQPTGEVKVASLTPEQIEKNKRINQVFDLMAQGFGGSY